MENRDLKVAFNEPLNAKDTEKQTYGCRANNPKYVLVINYQMLALSHLVIISVKDYLGHEQNNTIS